MQEEAEHKIEINGAKTIEKAGRRREITKSDIDEAIHQAKSTEDDVMKLIEGIVDFRADTDFRTDSKAERELEE